MGHSEGFLDAQWLAGKILSWMFANAPVPQGEFSLIGTGEQIEVVSLLTSGPRPGVNVERSQWPESTPKDENTLRSAPASFMDSPQSQEMCKTLTICLKKGMEKNLALSEALRTASPGERARLEMLYAKWIVVHTWSTPRIPSPNTWRRGARKTIRDGREQDQDDRIPPKELDDKVRTPFFYRNCALHISRETTQEELTFQLAVIFSRWGLIELTTEDLETFVSYLCHFWRRPEEFRGAAEGAVGFIFTNWVIPHHPFDFRRYARQTAWACYAKGARSSKRDAEPRSARFEEESAAEERAERHRKGKGSAPLRNDYISISELARVSKTDPRRIYESIKAGRLKATKRGMSLRIEKSSAYQFIQKALPKHQIHDLVCKLENAGKKKEAIRKQIYRLRRAGFSDAKVIERLKIEHSKLAAAEMDSEDETNTE